ncbi:MAG: DinB family protein [Gemmataceae bacterium]|nr:DinB family protein [Gemmataceae bacterium]
MTTDAAADGLADRFRRWFVYERDAHAKVFASLGTVPADRRGGPEYKKAVALMGHIAVTRQMWLYRLGGGPCPVGPPFIDDIEPDLAAVSDEWRFTAAGWDKYLAGLTDADLVREFEYRAYDGGRFRNRVEDALATLFGHSSYHRGQVAVLVRAAGGTPAATDLIYWCREPVG